MTNQFEPLEFLKLTNGFELPLRPTNILRYGLEAYSNSVQVFTHGMTTGTHQYVNKKSENVNGKIDNWFTCQVNIIDGWTPDVHRQNKASLKSPRWLGESGIFRGDCEYYCKKADDMRRHFLHQHPGICQDYVTKCPACHFSGRSVAFVSTHMNTCKDIHQWAENGCDISSLCPKYILNLSHWSSDRVNGGKHLLKTVVGNPKESLKKLRELLGGKVAKDVNATPVENNDTLSIQSGSIGYADVDSLLESETEDLDAVEFGPPKENVTHTNAHDDIFDVNKLHHVSRMYSDKNYREDRSDSLKNETIIALCKAVLERQTLLDIGHKLNVIRKKFEGYSLDCEFLWEVQGAFHERLGGHIVKSEGRDPFESLESFFPVGSLNAENVKKVHKLLTDYEKNHVELPRDQIQFIDLTGDYLAERKKNLELNEQLFKSNEEVRAQIAAVCLGEKEYEGFKRDSLLEKNKISKKLSYATQAIKDLELQNSELKEEKRLEASARVDMQKLAVNVKKDKLVQIDMFANIPPVKWGSFKYDKSNGKTGTYGIHDASEDTAKKEQRKLEREQKNKRKVGMSYADELAYADRSRKAAKLTSAEYLIPKPGNKKCGMQCEDLSEANYRLIVENGKLSALSNRLMLGSAVNYRQYLCSQAFCEYSMQYLYGADFSSKRRMHRFLYNILPRFVETFKRCSIGMDEVKPLLIDVEAEAWNYLKVIPTSQIFGYFFCEEMILRKTKTPQGLVNSLSTAESLNLCTKCDDGVAGHPPNTCELVTVDMTKEFQCLRKSYKHSWMQEEASYDLDSSKYHIGAKGIELGSVNTYL